MPYSRPLPALLLALLLAPHSPAQGTKADYERAASLGSRTRDAVFRDRVRPQWIAGGPRFWYRIDTGPGQHEFVLVDPAAGTRAPAFDHQKLAAALSEATGKPADAAALPLDRLEFAADPPSLTFRSGPSRFRLNLEDSSLTQLEEAPASPASTRPDAPRASRRTGDETHIVFVNKTPDPVELFWLGTDGRPTSYGKLAPGTERSQHTFEGHVWSISGPAGRELVRVEAGVDPDRIEIDGKAPPAPQRPRVGQGNRRPGPGPARSPDGKWEAFVRDHNLFLRPAEGDGEPVQLTTDGSESNTYRPFVHWSPDSSKLIAIQVEPAEEHKVHMVESSPADQLQPRLKTIDYLKPGDRIDHPRPRLVDLAEKKAIPIAEGLFPNPWSLDRFSWADDSSRFTFLYNERGHQALRLVSVDARTGDTTAIIDERSTTFIDYNHKTYLHKLEDSDDLIWMSERDGWNHLYLVDGLTGDVKSRLTKGEWVVRRVERVDEEAGQVWFWALGIRPGQDPYHEHLARVDLDGSNLAILTDGDGTHTATFSPDGAYLLDTSSRVDLPPATTLRRSSDGSLVADLETADASALSSRGWTTPERFTAKGRDGKTDIYGVIYTPSNFDATKKYPVVEQIYAGPHDFHVPKAWGLQLGQHELAELGFIVVQIDGMGTNWRSKAFHDVCWKNLGDAGFPDRIAWMKAAAESRPWMDLSRVGIYGGSAGGQNALGGLLRHPDFYRVAAADCGCHDNRMDKIWWNELWMGYPVGPHYEEASNVAQAHRLQGKVLLIVGELDTNVDPASTMQVVDALIKADKDFDLLVVPGAGHGAGGSPYGRRRQRDFFVRHLLGVEPRQ